MSTASRASFSDDSRIIKINKPALPKSLLLRDYLLEDMSSCSSNGFRSYPRRQCCTTVRFLVESDLNKHSKLNSKLHRRSNIKPKQSSMLQKASAVMIHVFKRLPFAGAGVSRKASFLPRSLSRKLLKHGFWKNSDVCNNNEVKRLKSFGDLLKEDEISQTTRPPSLLVPTALITTGTTELPSLISNSNSNSNSNRWCVNDSMATNESFSAGGNYSEVDIGRNDVIDELPEAKGKGVGTTTATATATKYSDSTGNAKWQDKHDEQFSPVSVMDFPSDNDNDVDEDDEVSSVFPRKHLNVKGTKLSTRKTRVSTQLEPVKLEDRIAQSIIESPTTTLLDVAQEENQSEKKAMALLQLMKSTVSSHHSLIYEFVETVLLEFFKEGALEGNFSDYEMLQRAKDWMDREQQDVVIDWECNNNREAYISDMEKGVKWSNYDHQLEKVNVGLEVECEVFDSLVNDVLIEFNLQDNDNEDNNFR